MSIVLTGQTVAEYGNPERRETLAGATLVFYAADKTAARTRWGYYPLSPDSPPGKEIARTVVQADGRYEVRLPTGADVILVALDVSKFDYAPATNKRAFGLLGPARPVLRKSDFEEGATFAVFNVSMVTEDYAQVLEALDLWLVAGRVVASGTSAGVQGVQVTAFDRDITQDDTLGNNLTDTTGSFEIFFPGDQFRQVPALPPPFDKIGFVELIGGPDLFFRVDAGAIALLNEAPSIGRTVGRENVLNISYTVLTVTVPDGGTGTTTETGLTAWRAIGNIDLTDIDGFGLTTSGQQAFMGGIELRGAVFRKALNGEAVKYRFLVKEIPAATTSGAPALPALPNAGSLDPDPVAPAGWTAVTDAILPRAYGSIESWVFSGGNFQVLWENLLPAASPNGWITVDQRALTSSQAFVPTGLLIQLDTNKLVPQVAATATAPRKFALVLQMQTLSASFQQGPATVLQICNNGISWELSIPEKADACSPVTEKSDGTIDISATFKVSHPYLRDFSVVVQKWNGTNQADFGAASHGIYTDPGAGPFWSGPPGQPITLTRTGYNATPCSYEVVLSTSARLTDGISGLSPISPRVAFCVS